MSAAPGVSTAGCAAEECWLDLEGHRLRYLRAGSGPALLLLHGLLGYSFSWRLNLAALAAHATVYAPDLLGIGFSERVPALDYSLRAAARRMLRFLELAGIERADLLGTSHGGGVAAMMAALDAEAGARRLPRLILVAPINPWSPQGRHLTRFLASWPGRFLARCLAPLARPLHGGRLRSMYGDPRRVPPGTVEGYSAALAVPGTVNYLLAVMRCWHHDLAELERVYPRVAQPTLLLWGSRDPAVLPESAERVQQAMPRAELVMLPGVGHLPYEESPQEFNQAVLRFLGN
jgi:pimeloyl-ACP methyl ester carboxylesterase